MDRYRADIERANNTLGKNLSDARRRSGLSIKQAAAELREYGVLLQEAAVSKWEHGVATPSPYQLRALCDMYGASMDALLGRPQEHGAVLAKFAQEMLNDIRAALESNPKYVIGKPDTGTDETAASVGPEREKRAANRPKSSADRSNAADSVQPTGNVRDIKSKRRTERATAAEPEAPKRRRVKIRYRTMGAAAGIIGNETDGAYEDTMTMYADEVPRGASYVICISGDSMEPLLTNGEYAFVDERSEARDGQIGVFNLDGRRYIKRLRLVEPDADARDEFTDSEGIVRPKIVLESINPKYDDIVVPPDSYVACEGRVIVGISD